MKVGECHQEQDAINCTNCLREFDELLLPCDIWCEVGKIKGLRERAI